MLELTSGQVKSSVIIEQICNVFESCEFSRFVGKGATYLSILAVVHAARFKGRSSDSPFSILELEWFSRNSYNLALQSCTAWDPQLIMRLLNSCIKVRDSVLKVFLVNEPADASAQLTDLYPTNLDSEISCNLALRRLLCDFLGAIISMAQARIQVDSQLQVSFSTPSLSSVRSLT